MMNKFTFALIGAIAVGLLPQAIANSNQEALELLLANSHVQLKKYPLCEPHHWESKPSLYAKTLAQDMAWVLAEMAERSIDIESVCEINRDRNQFCEVVFSVNEGALVWSRVYQFETVQAKSGSMHFNRLRCFNLP